MNRIHTFHTSVAGIALPSKFTYPFCYTPHPLCVLAAGEVRHYLSGQAGWQQELAQGKMFGVLVVQTAEGKLGYLAAYSGNLAGKNDHPYFVPPVYDLLNPEGFFRQEETRISRLNQHIEELEATPGYLALKEQMEALRQQAARQIEEARQQLKAAKAARDLRRQASPPPSEEESAAMIRESQHQKAEYKRLERHLKAKENDLADALLPYEAELKRLKEERRTRSASLQHRLFGAFRLLNARGEVQDLNAIFRHTPQRVPPAGTGECAAPKLLQYAYLNHLHPVAMAEFWVGQSPRGEVRHDGHYYPACRGKCGPILAHMLQGLDVEDTTLRQDGHPPKVMQVVYEDPWLLVLNKPAGMLSVPGKEASYSAWQWVRDHYPQASGPLLVHRLDMDTSGLLLAAKTKEVHQQLQALFHHRHIRKTYLAVLQGIVAQDEGRIDLPLLPDPLDRPRQRVDREHGKPATTLYEVLQREEGRTRILFHPLTGRTHQLRVHAAHPDRLHCPILGDRLYGTPADRLYLHALRLEFIHPVTGEALCLECEAEF